MYWTAIVVLLLLWIVGLATGYTLDGVIHVLPLMAIVITLIKMVGGKRPTEQGGQS